MEQRLLTAEEIERALVDCPWDESDTRLFSAHGNISGDRVLAALRDLPLVALDSDHWSATLTFETARPLTAPEAWRLAMLGLDTPETIEPGQTKFRLWWD